MKKTSRCVRTLGHLAIGAAVASFAMIGVAKADTDGIINTSNVPQPPGHSACPAAFTPTAFSFDISWIDKDVRAYFLADRSHGTTPTPNPSGSGDVLMIDINGVSLTSPNTLSQGTVAIQPPVGDPFAGIVCDSNSNFGGTTSAGRNELTGPNGLFTVNHSEVWVGDGPSFFALPSTETNTAADYNNDSCDSSVRVFDIASRQQTDHINVGGCFRTDEGAFDPNDQVALFANPSEQPGIKNGKALNNSAFITFLDTRPVPTGQHHKILKQISLDGTHGTIHADMGIEQSVYSEKTGLFYLNIPGASSNLAGYVIVIDPRDRDNIRIVDIFTLKPQVIGGLQSFCAPTGGALGPDNEMLLGCSNNATAASAGPPSTPATAGPPEEVIDIRDGHVIKVLTGTSGGCDEVAFNAGDDHFVGACTDSNALPDDNLDISDADPPNFDQAIDTHAAGAHSVTTDPVTVSDWQPAAAAAGAGPNVGSLCGANPCVLIYKSTGGDDPSEHQQEAEEDHHHHHW